MRLDYEVIMENKGYALIKRGTKYPEYAVVWGLKPETERKFEGNDWGGTVGYAIDTAGGLAVMVDLYRERTEENYISRERLEELCTKFKDKAIELLEEDGLTGEGIEYKLEEFELEPYEREWLGFPGDTNL